jgi:hypothetical protein
MGGGGGGSGPTLQQQQLETAQALTTANLNLEENAQRKSILNAMSGTRVFRGSALSRAVAGNNEGGLPSGAPSKAQTSAATVAPTVNTSLLDSPGFGNHLLTQRQTGATTAGGQGASGATGGSVSPSASTASALAAAYAAR